MDFCQPPLRGDPMARQSSLIRTTQGCAGATGEGLRTDLDVQDAETGAEGSRAVGSEA